MRRTLFILSTTILTGALFHSGCSREMAALTPPPPPTATPTFTSTSTPTHTPTATATTGGGGGATPTPSSAVMYESFDSGGAECCYSDAAAPGWLASSYVQGTTTEGVTCTTAQALSGTHSMECSIDFDASGDLAEVGIASWSTWGGTINASAATGYYSFWVSATGPVTIANLYICQSSCLPQILNPGINLAVPGDGQWHNFLVPIGSPTPPSPWVFNQGAAPWTQTGIVQVFFDMVGPAGPVVVHLDDIYFYP
ncbi:MAG TPA: hypothetical protein VHE12_10675 [bacterium]|nr:hypothetical protein [bacterium]